MQVRPTQATIDLAIIRANLQRAKALAPGALLCAVVKANAYGHGIVPVGQAVAAGGADWLGVALVEEGVQLRTSGVRTPTLVWGAALHGGYEALVEHELTPVVSHAGHIEGLAQAAAARAGPLDVHLEVDTGMARLGVTLRELDALLAALQRHPQLRLTGLMSHFASADQDTAFNGEQFERWQKALQIMQGRGLSPSLLHMANSPATVALPYAHQAMVRCGLLLYGLEPMSNGAHTPGGFAPALRWTTALVNERILPAGAPISYGCRFTTSRTSRIGTIPVGYADGFFRCMSHRGEVLVRGRRVPVVGTVCMDMCMVDLTGVPEAQVGDEVVILGTSGQDRLLADDMASWCDTISYEILCALGARVPRHYLNPPGSV